MLLNEVKTRELFDKYKEAYEYIYFKRYFINTFNILISSFDEPPISELRKIKKDLKDNFPMWKQNEYLRNANIKEKIKGRLFMLPVLVVVAMYKIKQKI